MIRKQESKAGATPLAGQAQSESGVPAAGWLTSGALPAWLSPWLSSPLHVRWRQGHCAAKAVAPSLSTAPPAEPANTAGRAAPGVLAGCWLRLRDEAS
jgi:hypothetical protein